MIFTHNPFLNLFIYCTLVLTSVQSFRFHDVKENEELVDYLMNPSSPDTYSTSYNDSVSLFRRRADENKTEENMNFTEFIQAQGFPVEIHDVTTEDGFILSMGRIPYNSTIAGGKKKQGTFFIQHALLCSATDWVIQNEISLPYMLAKAGYEVWLGNARGNTYSDRHVTLNKKDKEFWDWSFDEMAKYDLPVSINYALNISGDTQTYYVGHSQGTLSAFIAFDINPALGQKIKEFFALAPIARLNGMGGLFKTLTHLPLYLSKRVFDLFGKGEFLPSTKLTQVLGNVFCGSLIPGVCETMIFLICGWGTENFDSERLPIELAHTPAGTSTKNFIHYALNSKNKNYAMYDYGNSRKNKNHYGQSTPPLYGFEKYNVPTTLIYGSNDILADIGDVNWLMGQLKDNLKRSIEIEGYQHLDFIWGKNVNKDVYSKILDIVESNDI